MAGIRWLALSLALVFVPAAAAEAAGRWRAVPDGPLGPRENAVGVWTGREVLLVGGSDAPPCPPNADCRPTKIPPPADGGRRDQSEPDAAAQPPRPR